MLELNLNKCHVKLDLQLFSDGAAASSGGADGGAATGQEAVQAEVASPQYGRKSKAQKNPLASVQYGREVTDVQDPAPVAKESKAKKDDTTSFKETPEERERRFEELIQGEFADLYGKRVKSSVDDRFKSTKETVEKYETLQPMIEILAKKYNIDKTDVKAIVKAVEEDDSYLEQESIETGTPTEQLRRIRSITRENERLAEAERTRKAQEESRKIYQQLSGEAEGVKKIYPAFDLRSELKNPEFKKILGSGVSMKTAYEAIHAQELVNAAMSAAAQDAEARVMNSVRQNGSRPQENGNRSSSTAVRKTDVHSFTKADRAEIARRAMNGEKIVL